MPPTSSTERLSTLLVRDGGRAGTVTSPNSTSVDESWLVYMLRLLLCEGVPAGVCLLSCSALLCEGVVSRDVFVSVYSLCWVRLLCEGVASRDVCPNPDSDLPEVRALLFPSKLPGVIATYEELRLPGVLPAYERLVEDGEAVSAPVGARDVYSSCSENMDETSSSCCPEYVDASSLSPEYAEAA